MNVTIIYLRVYQVNVAYRAERPVARFCCYLVRPLDQALDIKRSIKPIENIIRKVRPVFPRGTNGRTMEQEKKERPIKASPINQKITAKKFRKVHFNKLIFILKRETGNLAQFQMKYD